MGILSRSVSGELGRLQAARNTLESEAIADQTRLQELRGHLGEAELSAVLDGADPGPLRREIADLEIKIAGRLAAHPKLLGRIREALKALGKERAVPLLKKAAEAEKKLQAHNAETRRLLGLLESQSGNRWERCFRPILPDGFAFAPGELPPMPPAISERIAGEIAELRTEAARAESLAEAASEGGSVTGATLAELQAVSENLEAIGPTPASIEAWFTAATARADAAWARVLASLPGGPAPGREVFYTLAWNAAGEIDQAASRAENRELRAPVPWTQPAQLPARASGY